MAKTKQFKTESKQLLNLMINSIYTHKEIFLRELISNASDAIDKRHYEALTNTELSADYRVLIEVDHDKRTLSIQDNGIGLTEKEMISNLGTIAKSGTQEFKEKLENKEDLEIIGQFGVGFYSAFMVADKVTVISKSIHDDQAYIWESTGTSNYTIKETEKEEAGTTIILHMRENDAENEDHYDEFLNERKIKSLIKKYSDYVRYPIQMEVTKYSTPEDEKEDPVEYKELETLNSMVPLWRRQKSEVTDEEYAEFYKHQFDDFEDPLKVIHTKVEGLTTYTSLLFIPKKAPYDLYSEKYEKGLQLYSKGVFIMDKNKQLIGDHFRFIRGLVDTADLSLNLSREMLQHDRQLSKIASALEKKIKSELEKMQKNERELYDKFYKLYGLNLKYGLYEGFGAKKELLQDLIMFKTTTSDDYITLKEYVERKKEDQKYIYYASGKTKASIMALPQMDLLKEKGYEVLLFTDEIDEFMINVLMKYEDMEFKSINQGDLDLIDKKEEKKIKKLNKDKSDMLKELKSALGDQVSEVRFSTRLKDSPVCIVSNEGLSMEMERVLKSMPNAQANIKAEKVLEINPNHALYQTLEKVFDKDHSKIANYAKILYNQALLIEGMELENPVEFSNLMVDLMVEANK